MAVKFGITQTVAPQAWSGLTTKTHLASLYQRAPQKVSGFMVKLLAAEYGASLESLLSKFPTKYFDTDDDYTWKLIGSYDRNLPLVEARFQGAVVAPGDTGIGAGGMEFEIVFGERMFSDAHMIVGEKNEHYQLLIKEEPRAENLNWVYRVELMAGALNGMPGAELQTGKRFSKDFSPASDTLSSKGGDVWFSSPIELRNNFSSIRMQTKVPGNMVDSRVIMPFTIKDPKTGKTVQHNTWMQHLEWNFEYAYAQEKNKLIYFARNNRDQAGNYFNKSREGFEIKQGAGIRQQMEISNVLYYNDFNIGLIENMLSELSEGKLSLDDRHFVLRTGERGATQFHKAVMQEISGWQSLGFDNTGTNRIQNTTSPLHSNAMRAGTQFTEWLAPNGIKIGLELDPIYDDKIRNKIIHPEGGVAESYRYDILDIGTVEGEPNIQICKVKGQDDVRKYIEGLRNPFTGASNTNMFASNGVDASEYIKACFGIGAIVRDPSRTASIIPSELAA